MSQSEHTEVGNGKHAEIESRARLRGKPKAPWRPGQYGAMSQLDSSPRYVGSLQPEGHAAEVRVTGGTDNRSEVY